MIRYKVAFMKYTRSTNEVISPFEDLFEVHSKKIAYYRIEKMCKDIGGINYRTDTSEGDWEEAAFDHPTEDVKYRFIISEENRNPYNKAWNRRADMGWILSNMPQRACFYYIHRAPSCATAYLVFFIYVWRKAWMV